MAGRLTRRACLAALAVAPAAASARVTAHVPVMTRLVKLFVERETALLEAEAGADRPALERWLAPEFEQRDAAAPGRPLARAAWLAAPPMAASGADAQLEQMAVHDLGERALVSFLVRPAQGAPRFLVDLWRREGEAWLLQVRYASAA